MDQNLTIALIYLYILQIYNYHFFQYIYKIFNEQSKLNMMCYRRDGRVFPPLLLGQNNHKLLFLEKLFQN